MVNRFADGLFWIAVACCVVAQAAIVRSSLVSPAQAPSSDEPASVTRRALEVCWAVVPGIALAFLFVATWHAMHGPSPAAAAIVDSMSVR
jgi:heme/copper-type cytochrome/quinol oxidase subunit 2